MEHYLSNMKRRSTYFTVPGQANVTRTKSKISYPSILLELKCVIITYECFYQIIHDTQLFQRTRCGVHRAQVLKYLQRWCWIYVRKQGPTKSKVKNNRKIMPCLKWSKTIRKKGAYIHRLSILKQVFWRLTHISNKAPNPRPPNNNTQIWVITWIQSASLAIWIKY
jgi:hypothetical protein